MVPEEIFEEMERIGRMLESRGLILSARSGNMSVRVGDKIYIKRSGAMMRNAGIELTYDWEIAP